MPHHDAIMKPYSEEVLVHYISVRYDKDRPAEFIAPYLPMGPTYQAAPGMLDHWLTERYCLYSAISLGGLSMVNHSSTVANTAR